VRALAFTAGVALLAAAVTPTYPVESMALWLPGLALILAAIHGPRRTEQPEVEETQVLADSAPNA
jgi:hypothetical protein